MSRHILHRLLRRHTATRYQAGDTLVEVLICIAVISLVLAAGYATTNRNVSTNQDTQERSQALQIAQRQVELLRSKAQSVAGVGTFSDDSCLVKSGSDIVFKTDDDCTLSADSGACDPSGADLCYDVALRHDNPTGTYTIKVEWQSLRGQKSMVALDYRV